MNIEFSYIRNRIAEYRKDDLFDYCYQQLDRNKDKQFPDWYIFTLIKWAIIYGEKKYPPKQLTPQKFNKIYNAISNFNEYHISSFLKEKRSDKAFQILYYQQFYLQKTVYKEIYATQLKLFSSINGKHDIEKSFFEKTGFTILDFLYIQQIFWLYINIGELKQQGLYFYGFFDTHFLNLVSGITSREKVKHFINLLTLNPNSAEECISSFRHKINKVDLQTMEMSFFTMFPFSVWKNQIKLVHKGIFKHTINYYLYDFLKSQDENFTTDFGYRLERYIELGLKEIQVEYKTETELKKILPPNSNLTDFYIENENIFIESKATEMQALPSVNPTDKLIYNALKSSLFKAYFEQLVPVSKSIKPDKVNWGVIITYKEFFWSHFTELFEIGKSKYDTNQCFSHIPPQNVFIIDIYTWNKVIQIVKDKKATLSEILNKAKENNSRPETSKQLFDMQLVEYNIGSLNLSYLTNEIDNLSIKNEKHIH
jgi:hypothetical protein